MKIIKLYSFIILAIMTFISGCSMQPVYNLNVQTSSKDSNVIIEDIRPQEDKETDILSLSITNCSYGILKVGDDKTSPDRLTVLRNVLSDKLGDRVSNKKVQVKKFAIYRNNQVHLRMSVHGNSAISGGIVASMIKSSECFADKSYPGGYDISENENGLNAVVIDINVNIDDKVYTSRIVKPAPDTAENFPASTEIWEKQMSLALSESIELLISKIEKSL